MKPRNTYSQPLSIIRSIMREEGVERVVARDDEASKVGEQLAAQVEDDEEEVQRSETDSAVGLRYAGLLLDVVEGGVFGQLEGGRDSAISDRSHATRLRRVDKHTSLSRMLR